MTLDREWEKFRGAPNSAARDRIHVTLNRKGEIYFNTNAHRIMGRPEAVHLYFNRQKDTIALSSVSARLNDAFPVREKVPGSYVVFASSFCQHFGISVSLVQKFIAADLDSEGNMLLDLSNTVSVRRPRDPKTSQRSSMSRDRIALNAHWG